MPSTVNLIVSKFLRRFPNCDRNNAERLFQDAHREILGRTRLREVTITVSLTDGTRLYDLTSDALKVFAADRKDTATSFTALNETTVDDMDIYHPGWRTDTQTKGDPTHYFIVGKADSDGAKQQVGFHPIPNETTSAGYPAIDIHCIREAALTGTETVPPQLLSDKVYLDVMSRDYCMESDREQYPFWLDVSDREISKNIAHVKNRLTRLPDLKLLPKAHMNRVV